jgi:hypothetical protein
MVLPFWREDEHSMKRHVRGFTSLPRRFNLCSGYALEEATGPSRVVALRWPTDGFPLS